MNQKLVVLIGSVAAFHLAVGGLFLAGGCAQEDPPMPPGIYVPRHGNALNNNTASQTPAAGEKAVGPESTLEVQEPQKVEPQKQAPAVVTPAPEETAKKKSAEKDVKDVKYGEGTAYKVVKGDSLWKLSRKFKVTLEDLAVFNGIPANARLYIGQTLMIPAEGQKVKEASPKAKKYVRTKRAGKKNAIAKKSAAKGKKAAVKGKKGIRKATAPLPADGIYTVKAGDNFTVIARRFGLRIADIQNANPNVNSSRLQIGQKLQLPSASVSSGSTKSVGASSAAANKDILDPSAAASGNVSAESKAANKDKPTETSDMTKLLDEASAPAGSTAPETDKKVADPLDKNNAAPAAPAPAAAEKDASIPSVNVPEDKNKFVVLDDGTTAIRLGIDMTVAEFCKMYNTNEEKLNAVNPTLPFDGKLKTGLLVKIPEKKLPAE